MELLALAIGSFGLIVALVSLAGRGALKRRIEDLEHDLKRRTDGATDEVQEHVGTLRRLMAAQAGGVPLTPEMIEEGRLWRDASTQEGLELVAQEKVQLLDVRTPGETSAGVLPGAQLIPLDQLEQRWREVPKGKPTLVYCAAGVRSAAACEFLSQQGYADLYNLEGGYGSWSGPTARPS